MTEVVADTHAIIWLLFAPYQLSPAARAAMIRAASSAIHVSAIRLVEIAYLIDKKRLPELALEVLIQLVEDTRSGILLAPITSEVAIAVRQVPRKLVPDMPDRIIAATAVHLALPLVTADSQIHSSGIAFIW